MNAGKKLKMGAGHAGREVHACLTDMQGLTPEYRASLAVIDAAHAAAQVAAPMVPPTAADVQFVAGEAENTRQREMTAQKNAIAALDRHGVNYNLELTEERIAQLEPLPVEQGKANSSGYVGVSKGRKDRWQAQVNHRAIGGFASAYEAGKAVTIRMIELAQGYTPPAAQPSQPRNSSGADGMATVGGGKKRKKPEVAMIPATADPKKSPTMSSWEANLHGDGGGGLTQMPRSSLLPSSLAGGSCTSTVRCAAVQ